MTFHAGRLLVARPELRDPHFVRSVVLLLDHDGDGALGVVINRPSELPLGAVLPAWGSVATEPPVLFAGGPVSPESALGVGVTLGEGPWQGFRPVSSSFGLVDLDTDPDLSRQQLAGLRVFFGYAGWGGGQLEDEIQEGSWFVVGVIPADLLSGAPQGLWRAVLRRQPGEISYLASYTDNPNLN